MRPHMFLHRWFRRERRYLSAIVPGEAGNNRSALSAIGRRRCAGPNAISPAVDPKLPYDAVNGFVPISLVAVSDYMLVVHPSLPVKSVGELIALARSRPGEVRFASTGHLGAPHLAVELLKFLAKIDVTHVPNIEADPRPIRRSSAVKCRHCSPAGLLQSLT